MASAGDHDSAALSSRELERMEMERCRALTATLSSLRSIVFPVVKPDPDFWPVLQIFELWEGRDEENETDQIRMVLADEHHLQRALLAPEARETIKNIRPGCIVQITAYTLHPTVNDEEKKRLIRIQGMKVVGGNFGPIGKSLMYFTKLGEKGNEWHDEDWEESYWDDPDPWEEEEEDSDDDYFL